MKPLNQSEILELQSESLAAEAYDSLYHSSPILTQHTKSFCQYIAEHVSASNRPIFRILDLGCASASLWPFLLPLLPPTVSIEGVDLSPEMLEIASSKYPDHRFRQGHFRSIPYPDSSFDLVVVSSAFHHISDLSLDESLEEIRRVLDEHGTLMGREPLSSQRFLDKGGYTSGVFMHLRHLLYHLTGTQELPEPDPGPDHHAYDPNFFVPKIHSHLTVTNLRFRNPLSIVLGRINHPKVTSFALNLDKLLSHRGGSEIWYTAKKNFTTLSALNDAIEQAFIENEISTSEVHLVLSFVQSYLPQLLVELSDDYGDLT